MYHVSCIIIFKYLKFSDLKLYACLSIIITERRSGNHITLYSQIARQCFRLGTTLSYFLLENHYVMINSSMFLYSE